MRKFDNKEIQRIAEKKLKTQKKILVHNNDKTIGSKIKWLKQKLDIFILLVYNKINNIKRGE
jgi:hypothetical protein